VIGCRNSLCRRDRIAAVMLIASPAAVPHQRIAALVGSALGEARCDGLPVEDLDAGAVPLRTAARPAQVRRVRCARKIRRWCGSPSSRRGRLPWPVIVLPLLNVFAQAFSKGFAAYVSALQR